MPKPRRVLPPGDQAHVKTWFMCCQITRSYITLTLIKAHMCAAPPSSYAHRDSPDVTVEKLLVYTIHLEM